jgi:hypothetical protein
MKPLLGCILLIVACVVARADENLLVNGDLEQGLGGWHEIWSRTPSVRAVADTEQAHGGRQSVRIEHTGSQDWSFPQAARLDVKPGEVYEFSSASRCAGPRRR